MDKKTDFFLLLFIELKKKEIFFFILLGVESKKI